MTEISYLCSVLTHHTHDPRRNVIEGNLRESCAEAENVDCSMKLMAS